MGVQKIAILGGGVGAMTAAWSLTSVPDWQDRYEITVYQMGWRLGGRLERPERSRESSHSGTWPAHVDGFLRECLRDHARGL